MNIMEEKLRNGVKDSLRQRFKEQRGKLEIMADILSVARNGACKKV
jgi:predicted transcriptional regulator